MRKSDSILSANLEPVTETKMPEVNSVIRATKLINFRGDSAEYHHAGLIHMCRKVKNRWRVTDIYFYA